LNSKIEVERVLDKNIKIQYWDVPGKQKFRAIAIRNFVLFLFYFEKNFNYY